MSEKITENVKSEVEIRPAFIDADWPTKIEYMNENENYYHDNGMTVVDYDFGYCKIEMEVKPRHLNSQGSIHGGWMSAIIDQAGGKAALSYGHFVVTAQLSINYHRGCKGGKITAIGREKNRGKHLGVYDVEVHDDNDRLLATGTVTLYILDREINFKRERVKKID